MCIPCDGGVVDVVPCSAMRGVADVTCNNEGRYKIVLAMCCRQKPACQDVLQLG